MWKDVPWRIVRFALLLAIGSAVGCTMYRGAKIVEGKDFSAGISLPNADGVAELSFVNYLSGFRFGVAEQSAVACEFYSTNRFEFAWGLYASEERKHFKADVLPSVTNTLLKIKKDKP